MSCELGAQHSNVSCSCKPGLLYYALFFELRRAAFVKTLELGPQELLLYLLYKKNKPHFIIPQITTFVNRVLQAGIKKRETIVSQSIFILLRRGRIYFLLCELSTILTSQRAGFEIIRGAALFLHLLKKTIFKTAYIYIYISPLIIPQTIAFVNRVVSCGAPFSNKNTKLLLKTPFYYTINHNFCQDSCSFKANLQLKPPFCRQNTHLFYTILLLFTKNYPQFLTFLHNFHYFFYYYYYIIIYIIYIILLKSNT